jgi:hypothetical protein
MRFGIRNKENHEVIEDGFKERPEWSYKDKLEFDRGIKAEFFPYFVDVAIPEEKIIPNLKLTDSEKRLAEAFSKFADVNTIVSQLSNFLESSSLDKCQKIKTSFLIYVIADKLAKDQVLEVDLFIALSELLKKSPKEFPSYEKINKQISRGK